MELNSEIQFIDFWMRARKLIGAFMEAHSHTHPQAPYEI